MFFIHGYVGKKSTVNYCCSHLPWCELGYKGKNAHCSSKREVQR